MFMKEKNQKQFLYKESYLSRRLQHDVMENGIAYIPCRVKSIDDIISRFSIPGCESLDSEFLEFIIDFIDFIPQEYPVVLEIIGPGFSPEEKGIISETIITEMDYQLGRVEDYLLHRKKRFWIMITGTIVSGIILGFAQHITASVPLEFFYVVFWLFADSLVRYLFIEKLDFKDEKMRAGRLASMKIEFEELDT